MNNLELKIKSFCDIGVSLDTENIFINTDFPSLDECDETTEVTLISIASSDGNAVVLKIESKEPYNEDPDYRVPTYVLYTESNEETIDRDDAIWNVLKDMSKSEMIDFVKDYYVSIFLKEQNQDRDEDSREDEIEL